jgi:hypothetical protein
MTYVVTLVVVVVVEPERDGVSMWPANAGKASVRLRVATALIRRKVFTLVPPER